MVAPFVTRGLGKNPRMITSGFGRFLAKVIKVVQTAAIRGSSALKRLPELYYVVKARLVEINSIEVVQNIFGIDKKVIDPNIQEPQIEADFKSNVAIKPQNDILITAKTTVRSRKKLE